MSEPEPRPSPSSIELLVDSDAEAAVRAEWEALAALGMSSLARHTSATNRPHLTLLARVDLADLDLAPAAFAELAPMPLTLGAPVLFGAGDRRVLARSVVPTADLLALHAAVHRAAGTGADAPHTAPGEWTPHVTLARRLRLADLPAALDLLGGDITAEVVSVRRWDPATATATMVGAFRP